MNSEVFRRSLIIGGLAIVFAIALFLATVILVAEILGPIGYLPVHLATGWFVSLGVILISTRGKLVGRNWPMLHTIATGVVASVLWAAFGGWYLFYFYGSFAIVYYFGLLGLGLPLLYKLSWKATEDYRY